MQTKQFWTRIYEKNIGKMVGVCYRYVGDRAVAEDLAHEAFLKAIEKSDSYRRLGGFENWLMRINLNTTLDYLRRQPQFVSFSEDDVVETRFIASLQDDTDSSEKQISASDLSESEILDAICALPERQRAVFNLYVFEKQNHSQIAETLKIGLRSSKRYLSEARTYLQNSLTKTIRHKKTGLMMLLPFFPRKTHAIDQLCRAKLSHLAIAPTQTTTLAAVNWAAMPKTSPWLVLSAAKVPAVATGVVATAVTGSVIAYQVKPAEPVTKEPSPAPVETRFIASPPNDTISVDTVETQIFASPQTEIEKDPEQQVKGTESSVSPLPETSNANTPAPVETRFIASPHSLKKIERNGFYGLADEHDHVVVYPKYSDIQPFDIYKDGWAMVSVFGFEGFIDTTGREIVAPKYESIAPFNAHRPGLARVRIGKFYGYIDTNGVEVVPIGQ